jgi:hypothetical protein
LHVQFDNMNEIPGFNAKESIGKDTDAYVTQSSHPLPNQLANILPQQIRPQYLGPGCQLNEDLEYRTNPITGKQQFRTCHDISGCKDDSQNRPKWCPPDGWKDVY